MASNTGDMSLVRLQVGDRVFITTMNTLNASPVLAAKFSQRWNHADAATSTEKSSKKRKPQKLFLDANPEVFQYVLDFLRHNQTPLIWDAKQGFDTAKYAAIYQMARYYALNDLAEWIKGQKYKSAVQHKLTYEYLNADSSEYAQKKFKPCEADHVDVNIVKLKGLGWVCPAGKPSHWRLGDCIKSCHAADKRIMTPEVQAKLLERETAHVLVVRSNSILNADLLDA